MGPAVRALGWAGRFLLVFAALYLATSLYSFSVMMGGGFALGKPAFRVTAEELAVSIPFSFNNTGYYDLNDANLTAIIRDKEGNVLSRAETLVASVARGTRVEGVHSVPLSIMKVFSGNMTKLLLEDDEFKVDISLGFRYAHALGFRLGFTDMSLPWGAPLGNLSVRPFGLRFNGTHHILRVELSFENHSPFLPVSGSVKVEVYNERAKLVGLGWVDVEAPPRSRFATPLELVVEDPSWFTGVGRVHVYTEAPFKLGPVVLPYG